MVDFGAEVQHGDALVGWRGREVAVRVGDLRADPFVDGTFEVRVGDQLEGDEGGMASAVGEDDGGEGGGKVGREADVGENGTEDCGEHGTDAEPGSQGHGGAEEVEVGGEAEGGLSALSGRTAREIWEHGFGSHDVDAHGGGRDQIGSCARDGKYVVGLCAVARGGRRPRRRSVGFYV